MAIAKPVIKSEMVLYQVYREPPHARYLYSDWQGSPPLLGMTCDVSGFSLWNNIHDTPIVAASGGNPGDFSVPLLNQEDETNDGIARAQSAGTTQCAQLPQALKDEGWHRFTNAYGCGYAKGKKKRHTHANPRTGSFGGLVLPDIFTFNKQCFRKSNEYWKNPTPPAGQAAWEAQAAACLVMNYRGVKKHLTGKQYWNLATKYNMNAFMIPTGPIDITHWSPIYESPEHDWTPPAPDIYKVSLDTTGKCFIGTPWDNHFNQCIMQPEISVPPSAPLPTKAKSHVTGGETGCWYESDNDYPIPGFTANTAVWEIDINYPFFPNGLQGVITFAVRIFHFQKWTFGDFAWLRATPA